VVLFRESHVKIFIRLGSFLASSSGAFLQLMLLFTVRYVLSLPINWLVAHLLLLAGFAIDVVVLTL
jgi:hypothetical protein